MPITPRPNPPISSDSTAVRISFLTTSSSSFLTTGTPAQSQFTPHIRSTVVFDEVSLFIRRKRLTTARVISLVLTL